VIVPKARSDALIGLLWGKALEDGIRGLKAAMNGEEKPAENAETERANKAA
jgi:hypothetical protein